LIVSTSRIFIVRKIDPKEGLDCDCAENNSAKYAAKIVSLTIAPEATLPLRSNVLAYIYNTTMSSAIVVLAHHGWAWCASRRQSLGIGEVMMIADSIRGLFWVPKFTGMRIGLSVMLLITLVSGCGSVVANSESFYQNMPRRPINWREYLTD
jgi:hypothetical protein